MSAMGISTDPSLLDVELPRTLIESPSVSTFLPEEEASICPLLSSNTNGSTTPLTFSHPLTPCLDNDNDNDNDNDSTASANLCPEDTKAEEETSSSSGSSSGLALTVPDSASTTLFNKHSYKHLPNNNATVQDSNGHGPNGSLPLSADTPSFVSWNWPLIRRCTFFVFMSSLLAMCAVVVAMIVTLPKTCNPKTAWYRGSVFYEIFPASFQDSNHDGFGDLRGLENRLEYFATLGVSAVRLNSIFPSPNYPKDFENITSLLDVSGILGDVEDLRQLTRSLHANNMSIILDLPLHPFLRNLGKSAAAREHSPSLNTNITTTITTTSTASNVGEMRSDAGPIISDNPVTEALQKWTQLGIDGFYFKGLEHLDLDPDDLLFHLAEWKNLIGSDRVLIVSESLLAALDGEHQQSAILSSIDLVDVQVDVSNGTRHLEEQLRSVLASALRPSDSGVWIHWTLGGVDRKRLTQSEDDANYTLAATLMQLMLPGTPSIFYGDEIALSEAADLYGEHEDTKHLHHLVAMQWPANSSIQFTSSHTLPWLPKASSFKSDGFGPIAQMIALRDRSPSIYKNAICKTDMVLANTAIRRSHDDILIVERVFPRRNSFVSVSNFGPKHVTMDMTSLYYSGAMMLQKPTASGKIYFGDFHIDPRETIVVKLDK